MLSSKFISTIFASIPGVCANIPRAKSCRWRQGLSDLDLGFQIPSVTAYETKGGVDFAITSFGPTKRLECTAALSWRSAAASEIETALRRPRVAFSPCHQRVRRGSVIRANSVTAPQLSEYHTAT